MLLDPQTQQDMIHIAATAAVTGLIGWIATGGRRALANWGKSKVEIAQGEVDRAMAKVAEAAKTPCASDDGAAEKLLDAAESHLATAKQLQALADGLSSAAPALEAPAAKSVAEVIDAALKPKG